MANRTRYDWVDAAKGVSILMVVMLYTTYSVGEDLGTWGPLHYLAGYLTPFRMPDFFAISGLFLASTLNKSALTFFDRRVVHYAYFYLLWLAIHLTIKVALGAGDPGLALEQYVIGLVEPYGVLWFIYVLALVNLAVKVLRVLRVPHWAAWLGAAGLEILPVHTGFYAIDQFAEYFVFFYTGYALAPVFFRIVGYALDRPRRAIAGLAVWAGVNGAAVFLPGYAVHPTSFEMGFAGMPGLHLVFAYLGMLALFITAGLVSSLPAMRWLTFIGKHSIVLYVAFALPMTAMRTLLLKTGVVTDITVLTLVVYVAALAFPFALYWMTQKFGIGRFLFDRPEWTKIDRSAEPRGKLVPAE